MFNVFLKVPISKLLSLSDGPNNTLGRAYNNTLGILAYLDRTDVPVIKGCTGSERQGETIRGLVLSISI